MLLLNKQIQYSSEANFLKSNFSFNLVYQHNNDYNQIFK